MHKNLKHHLTANSWIVILVSILALFSAGIWAFAELTDEVMDEDTTDFDKRVLLAMRTPGDLSDPLGPRWVEEIGRDFTALGGMGILTFITLTVIGFLLLTRNYRTAFVLALAVGTGMIASLLLKEGFDRPRPALVPHGSHTYTSSYPSGHSMMSTICYLTMSIMLASVNRQRRVRLFLVVAALLLIIFVGTSRVYLGVHWPTDVFAGWLAGALWALGVWALSRKWRKTEECAEVEE